jgi:DNA polymerase-3 subunit gamma/tau
MDVMEFDAASNRGIDEMRDIRDKVRYAPTQVLYKVYIIDEVHMLTTEAFNALLKTLEEPPPRVVFLLATTEPHKVPATIHSRCQRFDFRRIDASVQVVQLRMICAHEHIEADDDALTWIARLSEGGMRDALSLLDQAQSYVQGRITEQSIVSMTGGMPFLQFIHLMDAFERSDVAEVLRYAEQMTEEGRRPDACLEGMLTFVRDVLYAKKVPDTEQAARQRTSSERELLREQTMRRTEQTLFAMMGVLLHGMNELRHASQPKTIFEITLLKLCTMSAVPAYAGEEMQRLHEQVNELQQRLARLEQGGFATQTAPSLSVERPVAPPQGDAVSNRPIKPPLPPREESTHMPQETPLIVPHTDQKEAVSPTGIPVLPRWLTSRWPTVLQRIKEKKITIYAWFTDGEPLDVQEDVILVGFKNAIHRETTEKPTHKQVIEEVLMDVYEKPYRLRTTMRKEWEASATNAVVPSQEKGSVASSAVTGVADENDRPWIREAIQTFGEAYITYEEGQ